jgi:hypothetical protein
MAERPKDTRLIKGFNYGVDKRMPLGLLDQVIDKKTGNLVGFIKDGKFYNLGDIVDQVIDKPKTSKSVKTERTLNDIAIELNKFMGDVEYATMSLGAYPTDSVEYKEAKQMYDAAVPKVEQLQAEARTIQLGKQASTVDKDIKKKEEELKKAKDTKKPTGSIEEDLDKLKGTKGTIETSIQEAKTKSGIKPTTPAVSGPPLTTPTPGVSPASTVTETPKTVPTLTPTTPKTGTTPKAPTKPKAEATPEVKETAAEREAKGLGVAAGTDFALPETLFKNIPSLNAILKKYVNTPGMTPDAFRKALRDDVWYKQNSKEIKDRYIQYYNFRELQASGRAQGTTDYEMQIDKIEASLKKRAAVIGSAAASDPAALRKAAENLYITNRSEDQSFIDDFLAASIRPVAGMIGGKGTEGYSGQALTNYKELVRTARDNGFRVSDIIPGGSNERQVLEGIASGKIDINRIIQDTRVLAAQGQPQYVRDLLSQGYNLNQVFAPYRQTMAAVLEIDDPNTIDLNDPLLRSAISDKGDMNVYDFKKALRKDERWQYTEQARQDVSSATIGILRDFGFQG